MTTPPPSPWSWTPAEPLLWEQPIALLRLSGPDTLRVLHGQTSQDLQAARPGDWRSTCCLTPTARLRGLAEVLVDAEGAWLGLTAGDGPGLRQALDRVLFPADQVELGPLRPGRRLRVLGGAADPAAVAAAGEASGTWRALEGGGGWWLGANALLLEDTPVPAELAGLSRPTEEEAERWRLRQGEPAWPGEINDAFNPFELGLAARVSLNKGCYVGQETLAKLASGDGVKQQLRRWHITAAPAGSPDPASAAGGLAPGTELQTAEGTRAGQLTSRLALADGAAVGLAMVRRLALESATLWAVVGEERVPLALTRPEGFQDPPGPAGSGLGRRGNAV
ncbi:MAG: folate-binding protein [Cyanobacteriota bacterium]|nr:folate-binding protein [Cyanobacteriota bacterium]